MRIRVLARTATVAALATTLLVPPAAAVAGVSAHQRPNPVPAFRNSCDPAKATLPQVVTGNPGIRAGAPTGLYVWHENGGWRLRLTHNLAKVDGRSQRIEVRGQVTSSRPLSDVRLVKLEKSQRGEWVSVRRPGRTVMDIRFVNYGGIDGINVRAGCAGALTVTVWQVVKKDGKVTRVELPVFVGKDRTRVTDTATTANPRRVTPPVDATKIRILRTPAQRA